MKQYKTYFITCNYDNSGFEVITDLRYNLIKDCLYINHKKYLLVEYLSFNGKMEYSKVLCDMELQDIKIELIE